MPQPVTFVHLDFCLPVGATSETDCPPVPCNWRKRPAEKKKANHENSWSLPVHSSGNRQALRVLLGDDEDSSELVVGLVIALEFSFPGNLRSILFA